MMIFLKKQVSINFFDVYLAKTAVIQEKSENSYLSLILVVTKKTFFLDRLVGFFIFMIQIHCIKIDGYWWSLLVVKMNMNHS